MSGPLRMRSLGAEAGVVASSQATASAAATFPNNLHSFNRFRGCDDVRRASGPALKP
ncbi:hypothetical protein [Caulobacter sp. 17J65-9]|uniref:hypothetical protein n=1 Tax=Caulobacter sp. 17J65-9 TaxID=2709382 RepID=UPI0013CC5136|nr:hypothetical protein [Caulobacter sp. 17J65-9]NEX94390.1 hypothetical protein [Caulobacter sp. 17J65-9]